MDKSTTPLLTLKLRSASVKRGRQAQSPALSALRRNPVTVKM
ncbi:MAG TPA: hypothetical protein VFV50_06385 [Bdellovibrionales bacterium]|nr:hypothetical protein [Bdellovibrionales bacterium]